jgi:hypothetical protein
VKNLSVLSKDKLVAFQKKAASNVVMVMIVLFSARWQEPKDSAKSL